MRFFFYVVSPSCGILCHDLKFILQLHENLYHIIQSVLLKKKLPICEFGRVVGQLEADMTLSV